MRWLLLPLGLAIAAAAAWLLLAPTAGDLPPAPGAPDGAAEARPERRPRLPGAPMGEIDDASRRELDRVLEQEGIDP